MTHIKLKIINGGIFIFLGIWMLLGMIGPFLKAEVRPYDVGDGYMFSSYVTEAHIVQNGFGIIIFFSALILITKGVFMILHANVDKKKQNDQEDR